MNNVKRKGIIADCIMAITQQLEMIKHICKDPMIDNECDLIVDYLDNITKPKEEREELLEGEWNIPDEELEKSAELMKESIDKGILDDIADAAGFGGFTNDNPSTVDYDMLEDTQNPVDLDQANNIAYISGLEDADGELTDKGGMLHSVLDAPDLTADGLNDNPIEDIISIPGDEVDYQPDITLPGTGEVIE